MAAEDCHPMDRGATQSSPVLCRGTACTAAPLQRAVYWPPCVPRSKWQAARMCAAGLQQSVQGSRGCRGRSVRKDGKTALILAAGLTRRLPLSWLLAKRRQASATQMALLLRGLPAQRHRSASLVEEEPASREAPQQYISRCFSKMLPWSRCYIPMKKSCN